MASKLGLAMFNQQMYDAVTIFDTGFNVSNSEGENFTFDAAAFNTLPIVQITSPTAGNTSALSVSLAGSARDSDTTDTITSVKYWVDNGAKTTVAITPANAVNFVVPSVALTTGTHIISVEATDNRGATGVSTVSVTVNDGTGVQVETIPTSVPIGSPFRFAVSGGAPGDTVHIENTSGKTAFDNQDFTLNASGNLSIDGITNSTDFNIGANSWSFAFGTGVNRTATLTTTVATGMNVTVDKLNPILYKDEITLSVTGATPGTSFTLRLPNEGNAVIYTGTITAAGTWSKKLGAFASTWFINRQVTYEFVFVGNQTRQVSVTVQAPTHSFTFNGSTTITVAHGQPLTNLAITNAPVAKDTRTGAGQPVTLVDPVYSYEDLRNPGTKYVMTTGVIDTPIAPSPDSVAVGTYRVATSTTNQSNNTNSVFTYQVRCYVNDIATNVCTVNVTPELALTLTPSATTINSGDTVTFTIGGLVVGASVNIIAQFTGPATDARASQSASQFTAQICANGTSAQFATYTVSMTANGQTVSSQSVIITVNPRVVFVGALGISDVLLPAACRNIALEGVGGGGGGGCKGANNYQGQDGQPGGTLIVTRLDFGTVVLNARPGGGGGGGREHAQGDAGTSFTSPGEVGLCSQDPIPIEQRIAEGGGKPATYGGQWLFTNAGAHYGHGGDGETWYDDADCRAGGGGGGSGERISTTLAVPGNITLRVQVPSGGLPGNTAWPGGAQYMAQAGAQGALRITY